MRKNLIIVLRLLLYPTLIHILCGIATIGCCVPIIFPEVCPRGSVSTITSYAGAGILGAIWISTAFMLLAVIIHMARLNNTRAFSQLLKALGIWGCTWAAYVILAIAADVAPPKNATDSISALNTDTVYTPREQLHGPASLVIPISTQNISVDKVQEAPNLVKLEREHGSLFGAYITQSPRWSGQDGDDTFYTKPGHLVMVPPSPTGIPALVHVCFRRLTEGEPLPQGYTVIKPGEDFSQLIDEISQIPDFALDLGGTHFLLLAWRGSSHRETALRAINAAIAATDTRMQPLADTPTEETVQRMLQGREVYPGNTPTFYLSEPLAQDGAYQAELYANPGEPGVILVYIKDIKTDQTLRLLSFQAKYSDKEDELFRHDIPGAISHWVRNSGEEKLSNVFPHNTPLFAIKLGPQRQYFDVAFEICFKPSDMHKSRHVLMRRCYKVQAYDPPDTEPSPQNEAAEDESGES